MAIEFGDQVMGEQHESIPSGVVKVGTIVDYSGLRNVLEGGK